jgi:small conductance mechanosensitive channel
MPLPLQIVDEDDIAQADSLLRASIETRVEKLSTMSWGDRFRLVGNDLWHVGLKIVIAVAIFIVGRWLIKRLARFLNVMLEKWKVDPSLRTFIRSLVKTFLFFVLFYIIIAWLGVNTSLFVAIFAAAGLAIGMAMSGVFQNIAGGVVVLMLKPFKCGDWIEIQGQSGRVMDIRLFTTILRTADNRTVTLPNGSVATSVGVNYTSARTRRLEWVLSLQLGVDFAAVRELLTEIVRAEKRINTIPAPEVVLNHLGTNTIEVLVHGWVATPDYWEIFWGINAKIYETLPARGFQLDSPESIDVSLTQQSFG